MTGTPLRILLVFLLLLLWTPSPADGQVQHGTLEGHFALAGETPIDPPQGQSDRGYLHLYLSGDAAKALYEALSVEPVYDLCLDDGTLTRFQDRIVCSKHLSDEGYRCAVGIDIEGQGLVSSYAC